MYKEGVKMSNDIVGYDLKQVFGGPTIVCVECYDEESHIVIGHIICAAVEDILFSEYKK